MSETLKNKITQIRTQALDQIHQVLNTRDLESVRVLYLGRNGIITNLFPELKNLPLEEKQVVGPLLNALRDDIFQAIKNQQRIIEGAEQAALYETNTYFDVTATITKPVESGTCRGSLHVYTHTLEFLTQIFISMGYQIYDGPEAEYEQYNFTALNIPADHPARESHDTMFLNIPEMVMRTHTSPMQIRAMLQHGAPLALFAPGRTYRNEATDATHDFMFNQGEGLVIDEHISLSHLLGSAQAFLRAFFERSDLDIRVRPGYFPFVEPGLEIDATCPFCKNGCSICKHTRFIELMGGGMVHPSVLQAGGIDPERYQGFAFGFGIERLIMLKHAIRDIRLFHSNKLSFLTQFP